MPMSNWKAVEKNLVKDMRKAVAVAEKTFVGGVYDIHRDLIKTWYSSKGGARGLKRRTGSAARGWKVDEVDSPGTLTMRISNEVPHADHSKRRVIRPVRATWLTIPSRNILTRAGAPKYSGPKDPRLPKRHFVYSKRDSETAYIIADDDQGIPEKKRLLFILKKKVVIPARTSGLQKWGQRRAKLLARDVTKSIMGAVR